LTGDLKVRVVTIDRMVACGEISPPAVIQCDVEGADLAALRGAEHTLRAHYPAILPGILAKVRPPAASFLSGPGYPLTTLDRLPLQESIEVLAVRDDESRRVI